LAPQWLPDFLSARIATVRIYYSENLNWAAQNLRLSRMRPAGRGLDIADFDDKCPIFFGQNV